MVLVAEKEGVRWKEGEQWGGLPVLFKLQRVGPGFVFWAKVVGWVCLCLCLVFN